MPTHRQRQQQQRLRDEILAGIGQTDVLFTRLSERIDAILLRYKEAPLTEADRAPLLRLIKGELDPLFGSSRTTAIDAILTQAIENASLDSVASNLTESIDTLKEVVTSRDPGLWSRIEAEITIGPPDETDDLKRIRRMLDSPEVQRRRDLKATYFDPQRRWVKEDGYRLSDRVWMAGGNTRTEIDRIITEAIKSGKNPNEAARDLREFLNPENNPVRYDKSGRITRGNTRADIKRANNDARRIMRTEISRANFETTLMSADDVPGVIGLKYLLSNRHPKPDVCDGHAQADRHGMGPGVYPAKAFPRIPQHPNCLCCSVHFHNSADELIEQLQAKYGAAPAPAEPAGQAFGGAVGGSGVPGGGSGSGAGGGGGRPPGPGEPGEINNVNPLVRRGPNGIWGEDLLEVVDWEIPSERKVLSKETTSIMGGSSSIARVDAATLRKQEIKHRNEKAQWEDFDTVVEQWESYRKQRPGESKTELERWEFTQKVEETDVDGNTKAWPLLTVFEKTPDGALRVVTSHRRQAKEWDRLWNERGGIQQRRRK